MFRKLLSLCTLAAAFILFGPAAADAQNCDGCDENGPGGCYVCAPYTPYPTYPPVEIIGGWGYCTQWACDECHVEINGCQHASLLDASNVRLLAVGGHLLQVGGEHIVVKPCADTILEQQAWIRETATDFVAALGVT